MKIGVVNYLNTRPITRALEDGTISNEFDFVYDVPSALGIKLGKGELDIALIPVAAYLKNWQTLQILKAPSICSFGRVQSVKLYFTKPIAETKRVALDTSSQTSSALTKILFQKYSGLRPEFIEVSPNIRQMTAIADAALIIGDDTFHVHEGQFVKVIDLGQWWTNLTELPFVYAVWATGKQKDPSPFLDRVWKSFRCGREHIGDLAKSESLKLDISEHFTVRYLTKNIYYDLSDLALEGLKKYLHDGQELGIFSSHVQLKFYGDI